MTERPHRFQPRLPGQIDGPEPLQERAAFLVEGLQIGVLDLPVAVEAADDELAVTAHRERGRSRFGSNAMEEILQRRDQGHELGLIVRQIVAELDTLAGHLPAGAGDLVAPIAFPGITE